MANCNQKLSCVDKHFKAVLFLLRGVPKRHKYPHLLEASSIHHFFRELEGIEDPSYVHIIKTALLECQLVLQNVKRKLNEPISLSPLRCILAKGCLALPKECKKRAIEKLTNDLFALQRTPREQDVKLWTLLDAFVRENGFPNFQAVQSFFEVIQYPGYLQSILMPLLAVSSTVYDWLRCQQFPDSEKENRLRRNICLLICNSFENSQEARVGCENDITLVKKLFREKWHCHMIEIHDKHDSRSLMKAIEECAEDLHFCEHLYICVSSHGSFNNLEMSHGFISFKTLFPAIWKHCVNTESCSVLLQACQGERKLTLKSAADVRGFSMSDLMNFKMHRPRFPVQFVLPCYPGHMAYRINMGSLLFSCMKKVTESEIPLPSCCNKQHIFDASIDELKCHCIMDKSGTNVYIRGLLIYLTPTKIV